MVIYVFKFKSNFPKLSIGWKIIVAYAIMIMVVSFSQIKFMAW